MERKIYDLFGLELNVGDKVCFTLSMRKDEKPLVKGKITEIKYGKTPNDWCGYNDYIVVDYVQTATTEWAEREKKLPGKVLSTRVVKCY